MLIYIYFLKIKYRSSARKLLWFEITNMLIAALKKTKFTALFIVIFGTVTVPTEHSG